MFKSIIHHIRQSFNTDEFIPLHEPSFGGNEKKYLNECIDSTFVSSIGKFVDQFEEEIVKYTGAKYAIATVNGTAALHTALLLAGVEANDEVITQPLTFVATCNAIAYIRAYPVFVDVDKHSLSLSPEKLLQFLSDHMQMVHGKCINRITKRRVKAIVPMHTFGFPGDLDELLNISKKWGLVLIEDAAESLGSFYKNKHTGTLGLIGTLSFNGNKPITTGGGGMIITNDENIARKARHITTTAKVPHRWDFEHDTLGFNYRLPNINAALGCAQMENLPAIISKKRNLAKAYSKFFQDMDITFIKEPKNTRSNYWLNALILEDMEERNAFLEATNNNSIMTRPIWKLMTSLPMYCNAQTGNLENAKWLEQRVVNIPSSVKI